MREKMIQRRDELAAELESGRTMLADLEARRSELQSTLLRIAGALQVVTELLEGEEPDAEAAGPSSRSSTLPRTG